ncbi:MAG: hypothetical protein RL065_1695 [Bacteroidota bacterium]|jgi:hypothetical protein
MTNYERMIQLVDDIFAAHHDSNQLDVDESVIAQLKKLHPNTVSELIEGDGPILWAIIIPTTESLMTEFINKKISESELLNLTPIGIAYDALYLCSVMILPEYRNKGLALNTTTQAIQLICKQHPIKQLFVWAFTHEGSNLATKIAHQLNLPLLSRQHEGK